MTKKIQECKRSVAILSISLVLSGASYDALESLQSSINHETGTTALAVLYICYLMSSLFLPPLAITRLKCKKTMAIGMFTYSIYIAANFHPRSYTLIPAAILLGVGSGLLWPTVVVYVTNLSVCYAYQKKCDIMKYTKHFFSIIYFFVFLGTLFGAIFTSALLRSLPQNIYIDVFTNCTSNASDDSTNNSILHFDSFRNVTHTKTCGLYYHDDGKVSKNDQLPAIPQTILNILLTVYLVLSVIASLLCLMVTEIDENDWHHSKSFVDKDPIQSSTSKQNSPLVNCKNEYKPEAILIENTEEMPGFLLTATVTSNTKKETTGDVNVNAESSIDIYSTTFLVKSAVKLVLTDKVAVLFLIHTLHIGFLKALTRSTFNEAWISCWLGVEYVGHATMLESIVSTIMSLLSGYLHQFLGVKLLFFITMLIEASVCITLFLWVPSPKNSATLLVAKGLFGLCFAVLRTQTPSAYSTAFPTHTKQAAALQSVIEGLGLSAMFGLAGFAYPFDSFMVLLSLCLVGYVLFSFGIMISDKRLQNKKKLKPTTV